MVASGAGVAQGLLAFCAGSRADRSGSFMLWLKEMVPLWTVAGRWQEASQTVTVHLSRNASVYHLNGFSWQASGTQSAAGVMRICINVNTIFLIAFFLTR